MRIGRRRFLGVLAGAGAAVVAPALPVAAPVPASIPAISEAALLDAYLTAAVRRMADGIDAEIIERWSSEMQREQEGLC